MKILVTGATGFIGRRLVARLLAERPASDITCLVKRSDKTGEREALVQLRRSGVRVIEGDLDDPSISRESAPKVDALFHLAANIDTEGPPEEQRVNDLGTSYLLSWLGESLRGGRLVYASSIAVLDRDRPATGPLNELSPCVPRTEYGRSKLRGEQIIQTQKDKQGYQFTILRLATVYGPGAKPDGLFDKLFKLNARHSVLGRLNWPGRTSIVHVDDVAAIMATVVGRPETANQIYCIATPDAPTVGTIAEHIGRLVPEPPKPLNLPAWVWRIPRAIVWNPIVQASPFAHVMFWRLTLMLDDGFWFDTTKFQSIWTERMIGLDEGLIRMGYPASRAENLRKI